MRVFVLGLILFSTVFCSDVLDFGDSDFDDGVNRHDIILVEFFAPWCGHCKKLAPEYELAATKLKANDPPIALAKVDCVAEESKAVCSRFGVTGFPTLKVFRGVDNVEDYNGPREANGIVSYMKGRAGPSSKDLKTVEDFEKLKSTSSEIMVIGFFSSADSDFAKEFAKAANTLRESFKFAHTSNPDVRKAGGDLSDDLIVLRPVHLQSKLEESQVELGDSSAKSSKIQSFVKSNFNGLAGHYNGDHEKFFAKPLVVVYYQVDYEKNAKGTNYWRNRVSKVAKNFAGKLTFAVASKSEYEGILSDMDVNIRSADPIAVVWSEKGLKYKQTDAFSVESLEKFAQDYLDGKLEPYLKSEDIPADNSGPVKVVVAKNFDEIVNDPERDVLIEFYAPWCGHCKSLAPKYEELGEKVANIDSVVIAKMDATANDVPPPYDVKGFPTLYWAPKGNKSNPKKYEGGREVKDFVAYIKKEASVKSVKDEL